jgi:hypothetical protein
MNIKIKYIANLKKNDLKQYAVTEWKNNKKQKIKNYDINSKIYNGKPIKNIK